MTKRRQKRVTKRRKPGRVRPLAEDRDFRPERLERELRGQSETGSKAGGELEPGADEDAGADEGLRPF